MFCHAHPPDSLVSQFLNNKYRLSYRVRDIPRSFIKYYHKIQLKSFSKSNAGKFNIVDPEKELNKLDFGYGPQQRRLVFQSKGVVGNFYFIFFEKGN